jgi:hypothetical protein
MLQKEAIEPGTLQLLKVLQADSMFAQFHLAGGTGLALQIRIYSLSDIAAMKVNAIAGNGTRSKDFVDLFFLLEHFKVNQMLMFYQTKYKDRNTFHALKSLNYFEEVDLSDWPVLITNKKLTWNIVKATIDKQCKEYMKKL